MNNTILSQRIGFALMQAGLSPFALDVDLFQIVHEGENYFVYTDRLPELYIEKRIPLDYFEYRRQDWILFFAMDRVNSRRSPVVVFNAGSSDTITFRFYLDAASVNDLQEDLWPCFAQIEQAIDAFGMACEVAVRETVIEDDSALV